MKTFWQFFFQVFLVKFKGMSEILCETPGCKSKEARLQCPTCIKLGIKGSFFCSQECFKDNWNVHKNVHKKQTVPAPVAYNPWPGFTFTGNIELTYSFLMYIKINPCQFFVAIIGPLRPYPQTPKRVIPAHIGRPDYADHPEGFPKGEQSARGSSHIKTLNDEEKEGMRVVSKVRCIWYKCFLASSLMYFVVEFSAGARNFGRGCTSSSCWSYYWWNWQNRPWSVYRTRMLSIAVELLRVPKIMLHVYQRSYLPWQGK